MVLIDTSVWIRFLTGKSPFTDEVDRLLRLKKAAGHELVYGELLIGDPGGRAKFLSRFEGMHNARRISHKDVVAFIRQRRLHGRGIGWVDAHLLASSIIDRLQIWTADKRLAVVAKELNLLYNAPRVN